MTRGCTGSTSVHEKARGRNRGTWHAMTTTTSGCNVMLCEIMNEAKREYC